MSRKGRVFFKGIAAGIIEEHDDGYRFQYLSGYLDRKDAVAVSLSLPLRGQPYESRTMIPFFDGLIPEGWLMSETDDPEEMALTINGKKRALNRSDFDQFAYTLGINEKQYRAILRRFEHGLSKTASSLGRSFLPADMITRFQALIEERASRLGLAAQTVQDSWIPYPRSLLTCRSKEKITEMTYDIDRQIEHSADSAACE